MRGYVITGQERFLSPYQGTNSLTNQNLHRLKELTADNPRQQRRIAMLEPMVTDKLNYLSETVELRRRQGFEAAQKTISTGRGEESTDEMGSMTLKVVAVNESELATLRQVYREHVRKSATGAPLFKLLQRKAQTE